jgi:transposase InsO family protein
VAWKETDPVKERKKFVELYLTRRYDMTTLCELFEISRKTGYKFVGRFAEGGWEELEDRSHAARTHPNATDATIAARIVAAKHEHPRWGPRKLLDYLRAEDSGTEWPAISTAGEILKGEGLVRPRRRRRAITHPGKPRIEPITEPNQLFNLDFKGHFRTGDRRWCYPLTMTDTFSRHLMLCQGFLEPSYENTRAAMEKCFREYGLPDAMRTDNGGPFVSSQSLAGLSRLGVWLIKLGVERIRTRPGSPQDNGLHERMHRTLKEDTAMPPAPNLRAQQRRFRTFFREYNEVRPHESLGGATPASRYSKPKRAYPSRMPDIEYPGYYETRSVQNTGTIKWKGEFLFVSAVLHGERVGLEETAYGIWSLYFGPTILGVLDEHEGRIIG